MNTVVKRKLSSAIASKTIANNISKGNNKEIIKPISKNKQSSSISQYNKKFCKRQKKTHYNEKMGCGFFAIEHNLDWQVL